MELVIIALIAVEVVIVRYVNFCLVILCTFLFQALIRDGPELWQMVFGSSHVEDQTPARDS